MSNDTGRLDVMRLFRANPFLGPLADFNSILEYCSMTRSFRWSVFGPNSFLGRTRSGVEWGGATPTIRQLVDHVFQKLMAYATHFAECQVTILSAKNCPMQTADELQGFF
jgi:hypothetical protein